MASDAGYNENNFGEWPEGYQPSLYPELDFIDSATDLNTDFSVQGLGIMDDNYASEYESAEDEDSAFASSTFDAAAWFGDNELVQGHTYGSDLRPGERFNQKIPPSYDGEISFFAYERLVIEWCSITVVEPDKRAPMLLHAFKGHAVIYKEFLQGGEIFDKEIHSDLTAGLTKGCQKILQYIRNQTIKDSN